MPVARAYFTQLFLGTLYAALFLCLIPMATGAAMLFLPAPQWQPWHPDRWQDSLHAHRETLYWLAALLMAATLAWFCWGMGRVIG